MLTVCKILLKSETGVGIISEIELKEYGKMTGKISGLLQGKRPDHSYTRLKISENNNFAIIADL